MEIWLNNAIICLTICFFYKDSFFFFSGGNFLSEGFVWKGRRHEYWWEGLSVLLFLYNKDKML